MEDQGYVGNSLDCWTSSSLLQDMNFCCLAKAKVGKQELFEELLYLLHGKDADISEEAAEIQIVAHSFLL
ncbi:hypothetical protein M5K25_021703 [Dendrobium thyrsiflorum]|uniref:Uncharacterized protein n=1 Tax=Dendrobium thyrsiflorum TaxID=117978 RepID=A0ABD0UAU3_DENTH